MDMPLIVQRMLLFEPVPAVPPEPPFPEPPLASREPPPLPPAPAEPQSQLLHSEFDRHICPPWQAPGPTHTRVSPGRHAAAPPAPADEPAAPVLLASAIGAPPAPAL